MKMKISIFAFCLFSLGALLPSTSTFAESIDVKLYRLLHDSYRSPTMTGMMRAATCLGSQESGVAFCLVFSTYGNKYRKQTAKLAFTSMAISGAVVQVLKFSVDRRRPQGPQSRINSSFPSGHAAGSFALATVLAHRYPRYRTLSYAVASIIGFSRIYLGRHYPSDVLVGALLGYAGSRLVLHFQDKILEITF